MDVFDIAFSGVMLPITVLTFLVVGYWLLVIFGMVGIDLFDIDFDMDYDADVGDAATGDTTGAGTTFGILKFFHIGEVPIMILVSIFAFSLWMVTYAATVAFSEKYSGPLAILWIGPSLLISLGVTKAVLWPTSKFFQSFDGSKDAEINLVGRNCVVTSSEVTPTFGQAEVKIDGPPVIIDVRTAKGDLFEKGDFARVVSRNKVNQTYLIGPINAKDSTS
jgi:hypothetical protein